MSPPDATIAQRRAADAAASAWVAASAGTGKTKVLTDRVLNLLLRGSAPERILCLTFTKAAAAEMAIRIGERLRLWATQPDSEVSASLQQLSGTIPEPGVVDAARRLFARVLETPGGMKIQTIHSFCQSLLRRFPLEAGVSPHVEVLGERDANDLVADAREAVLAAAKSGTDPELAAAIAEVTRQVPERGFNELVAAVLLERGRLNRLVAAAGHDGLRRRLHAMLEVADGATPESILTSACAEQALDAPALRRAAEALNAGLKSDRARGEKIAAFLAAPDRRPEMFEAYASAFITADGAIRTRLATNRVEAALPGITATLIREAERLLAVMARRRACALLHASAALARFGDALLAEYERRKSRRAVLDYDDLILKTRELLKRPGVAPWVLYKLDGGIDHILIDEAQDTNPEQWEIVAALAEEFFAGEGAHAAGRTVFAVGDTKQSIYSFQRADPTEFLRMREHFRSRVAAAEHAARQRFETIDLNVSFRSTAAVLEAVDAVFSQAGAGDGVWPPGASIPHLPHRQGQAGLVELWPPVAPEEVPDDAPWSPPVASAHRPSLPRTRLAAVISATIRDWIGREELPARGRTVRAGDVMVLVRRRNAFVGDLVRALKQDGVPVAGVDRMELTGQLAVEDLVALGEFLLLPDDDLTLATVLKGPLFGFDEDALFRLCYIRQGSLWDELRKRAGEERAFAAAAAELGELLGKADFAPPYELFAEILSARSGRRRILERLGPEAADPIDEFVALALNYERTHPPSLQGFLHWLGSGETEIKRDLDQRGRDEVRIMTVHGAKGLQAPIVFLPDTLQAPDRLPIIRWTEDGLPLWCPNKEFDAPAAQRGRLAAEQRRDQEYRRLLYVAMTRAEDRLYICGWQTKRAPGDGCWYRLVERGLAGRARPFDPALDVRFPADGWPGTGLRLESAQTGAPMRDDAAASLAPPAAELPPWAKRPPAPEPAPPKPLTPSLPTWTEPPPRSPLDGTTSTQASGFQRGLIIHRLLQSLPTLPVSARESACRRFLARPAHGLSPEAQSAIAAETLAVLKETGFAPLFGPESQAEVPVVGLVGGHALSGQIDRLVVTAEEVLIVDYKTLRPPPASEAEVPEAYLRQLAIYAAAVGQVYPGRRVRAALLWTDGPRLMPVSPARLAEWAP